MPVYGRFLIDGQPRHAEVEGDTVYFVDDLFNGAARTGESAPLEGLKVLAPVEPKKLFAIGLNYVDHAKESGKPVPDVPLMWFKAPTAVIAHNETVEIAFPEHNTDYEAELTIVIGKKCKGASEENALDYVLGYTIGQDISDRHIQHSESQWARAKSFDTYAPLGPFIHTGLDSTNLPVETRVNGEVRQSSNTNQLVFGVAKLVAFLSEAITLEPGDCIMTGTPFGVGPLKAGDVIETRIGPMGPLVNPVL
ncbi:MAG TPA: fumarylacetoacetate hydrolase family protein [Abditibacteriaceae bacterium]|jgi:2-keto-4-pentenoate hydratase/2-oxohepta-3-ene-1,7-dioic acid hydratase in catechol pathway